MPYGVKHYSKLNVYQDPNETIYLEEDDVEPVKI